MTTKIARKLTEGDIIDLAPAVRAFFDYSEEELANDVSASEYAYVEDIDDNDSFVVVYTDQHNISVPPTYEFIITDGAEIDEDFELEDEYA